MIRHLVESNDRGIGDCPVIAGVLLRELSAAIAQNSLVAMVKARYL